MNTSCEQLSRSFSSLTCNLNPHNEFHTTHKKCTHPAKSREIRRSTRRHTPCGTPPIRSSSRRSADALFRQSRPVSPRLTGPRPRTHILFSCAQWNHHRAHTQPLLLHIHVLPFVCSPTMSPLTSHPLIRDTRAMVAPCPPAKVTAMVEDSATTSDLDGTPDVPTVTAEPACGTLWTSEMTTHPCTHRTLQAATSSLLSEQLRRQERALLKRAAGAPCPCRRRTSGGR